VYHLGITKHQEQVYLLVIVLEPKTDNAILASQGAINEGMREQQLDFPLEVMYVEQGNYFLETAKEYDLFYKK